MCLFVFLYLYPVAWGPKGHGSGGFYTFYNLFLTPTSLRGHGGVPVSCVWGRPLLSSRRGPLEETWRRRTLPWTEGAVPPYHIVRSRRAG